MTKIRIPLSEADIESTEENDNNYKLFIKSFINNTCKELKENLNSYHSVKEIECRRNLVKFFKQKLANFELLYLLDLGIQYLPSIREVNDDNIYEYIANKLAFVFENLKNTISPSWNVKEAVKSLYCLKEEKNKDKLINYDIYYQRLIKIYLQKENLDFFSSISFENNIIILNNKYKLTLCGDISNPEFYLIDPIIQMKKFRISKLIKYIEIENLYKNMYEFYKKFRALKSKIDMKLEGGFKQFSVNIEDTIIKVSKDFSFDKINDYYITLNEKIHKLNFSIDLGWYIIFRKDTIIDKNFIDLVPNIKKYYINQASDIYYFIKESRDSKYLILFKNTNLFIKFQEALDLENFFYRSIQNYLGIYKIKRHKKVVWIQNIKFKVVNIKKKQIEFELQIDKYKICVDKNNKIDFTNTITVMNYERFLQFLKNMCIFKISMFYSCIVDYDYNGDKISGGSIYLFEDYLKFQYNNLSFFVYPEYCQLGNIKIRDTKKYINFIKYVYCKGSIIQEYLSVDICGYLISYDPIHDRIISDLKNEEIFNLKNIQIILMNLKLYYKYNLFPDLVTKKYIIFYLNNMIYKLTICNNPNEKNWYENIVKYSINRDGYSNSIFISLDEFIDLYKISKKNV